MTFTFIISWRLTKIPIFHGRQRCISSFTPASRSASCPPGRTSPTTLSWQPKRLRRPPSSKPAAAAAAASPGSFGVQSGVHFFFSRCSLHVSGERERRRASPSTWRVSGRGGSEWTELARGSCKCGRDRSSSWTESVQTWPRPSWRRTPPRSYSTRYCIITADHFCWPHLKPAAYHLSACIIKHEKGFILAIFHKLEPGASAWPVLVTSSKSV